MTDAAARLTDALADRYRLGTRAGAGWHGDRHAIEIAARHGVADATLASSDPHGSSVAAQVASRSDALPSSGFSRVKGPR